MKKIYLNLLPFEPDFLLKVESRAISLLVWRLLRGLAGGAEGEAPPAVEAWGVDSWKPGI